MSIRRLVLPVLVISALAACTTSEAGRVAKLIPGNPTPAHFTVCHGNSCRLHSAVSLSPAEWQQVRDLFVPAPTDAASERRQIALATGLLETLAGRQAGTLGDAAGMGVHWDPDGQLDCIDETANTTQYLEMMAADGLLRFHHVGVPTNRFVFGAWGPSNTATIIETATGRHYAADSYFLANGQPASVLPIEIWLAGWEPEDGPPPAS
jgi:hypothetical protein